MSIFVLATPQISVNNITVEIVPNSAVYKLGFGTDSVKTQSAGGGVVFPAYSQNVEEALSEVKFDMYTTDDNLDFIIVWKNLNPTNTITVNYIDSDRSFSFNNMALLSDPDINSGADGKLSFDFKGSKAA